MDNRTHDRELFSRGPTPPQNQPFAPATAPAPQHPPNSSSSDLIDSLFNHIMIPQDQHQQQSASQDAFQHSAVDVNSAVSAPVSPAMPLTDEQPLSSSSAPGSSAGATVQERQSALLSLLNQPSGPNRSVPANVTQPQQVSTPPARSNVSPSQSHTENQKILLEQLMGTALPRSNVIDNAPQSGSAPSPSYNQSHEGGEYRSYNQYDQPESSPRMQPIGSPHAHLQANTHPRQTPPSNPHHSQQSPLQQAHQVPLPPPQSQLAPQPALNPPSPRRSMFEFMSPFDHLSSTAGSIKKKPVPVQSATTNDDSSSWPHVTDPKRQSVENLLDTLTRGQTSNIPPQPTQQPYDAYIADQGYPMSLDPYNQAHVPPPPLPPKPVQAAPHRGSSPRNSPPKLQTRIPPQQHLVQAVTNSNRRDKDGSPGPRNGARNKNLQQTKASGRAQPSPSPPTQSITFDVSKPLDDVQAQRDSVKSTAIALVRQESVFLPGTTIGATHWVAYAMTRGRVRVISRSSGDRTLLQLPNVFASSTSVIDMAVNGNRLAGITSDGGFVLWELPDVIMDDVPGKLLLCIMPTNDPVEALRSVKWNSKEPDTLAIASDTKIYVIHLPDIANMHQPAPHSELPHISQLYTVDSNICAFDFDPLHYSLAAITEDSTLTLWNLQDTIPYAIHKVKGEGVPSFLTFVDGGIVVGRKNGTIFQLLAHSSKSVLSTLKFVNSQHEDPDMFGHANYDSRIQTLWIANSRRESIIACKLNIESSYVNGEEQVRGHFEQVVEFTGPKATIHFVILTGDSDPYGDEAHAACIAAKLAPGELALVAFSVHSSGVDQVLIRKEWFDTALMSAPAKFPTIDIPPAPAPRVPSPTDSSITATKSSRGPLPIPPAGPPSQPPIVPTSSNILANLFPPPRGRTPPSDEVENDFSGRPEENRHGEPKGRGNKGKNVNWKEKDDGKDNNSSFGGASKEKGAKTNDGNTINESAFTQTMSKEMKKTEDNLHSRISRLISKEMEKQNQRLEDARAHEQAEDFARQEKILKLISSELSRNTTRVVEMAVKSEVQNSVLPSLESITKNEVRSVLNEQVGRGLVDVINQNLPAEIEKVFARPDISNHFAHVLSSNLTPLIERQVKDAIVKTFIPVYSQQASAFHQDLMREVRNEINALKSEVSAWQTDSFRGHESSIRELELTVRSLSDQVKFLTMNISAPPVTHHHLQSQPSQGSPAGSIQSNMGQPIHRQQPPASNNQPSSSYSHQHVQYQPGPPSAPQPQQPPPQVHQQWFGIAAPQASHPATIPQPPPPPQAERTPPVKPDKWDEIYLGVLHTQDPNKLKDLLAHSNPDLIMPLNGSSLVSQAVILTLVHRLSSVVGETPPNDESFKSSLWWLQRSVSVLRPEDKLISDFIPRVLPNVQHLLNTTKQRLTILPGGGTPVLETARTLNEIQETLRRKVVPV